MIDKDDMIGIKEAAAILNVSEMSIRRWTNEGKLKCFRVGKKKERRFTKEELYRFLSSNAEGKQIIDGTYSVDSDSHISHFYRDEEEAVEVGLRYIKEGLDRGELVLVMTTAERGRILREKLERLGVIVPVLEDQGILTICTGKSTPAEQKAFVDEMMEKSANLRGFCLIGDMVWTREYGWDIHDLAELENMTNLQREGKNALFFCQYDVKQFSRDEVFMAMRTHTHTIYHKKLNTSPYYGIASSWESTV